jgi:hypothetical protein
MSPTSSEENSWPICNETIEVCAEDEISIRKFQTGENESRTFLFNGMR